MVNHTILDSLDTGIQPAVGDRQVAAVNSTRDHQDRRIRGALVGPAGPELAGDGGVLPGVPLSVDEDQARRVTRAVPAARVGVGVLDSLALCAAEGAGRLEVQAALALPVLCRHETRHDGGRAGWGAVLPEGEGVVAEHPLPLAVEWVADGQIGVDGAGLVV